MRGIGESNQICEIPPQTSRVLVVMTPIYFLLAGGYAAAAAAWVQLWHRARLDAELLEESGNNSQA
jgi:hypothetical protein